MKYDTLTKKLNMKSRNKNKKNVKCYVTLKQYKVIIVELNHYYYY